MADWLEPAEARALIRSSAPAESTEWIAAVDASTAWVEKKRRDLFSTDEPPVFVADAAIQLGTAMLAGRWYARMLTLLGTSQNVEFGGTEILRQDPDIAKMLGIGTEGPFVFGAGRTLTAIEVTTP